jgi:hypothetical protein
MFSLKKMFSLLPFLLLCFPDTERPVGSSIPYGMEHIEASPEDKKAELVDSLHHLFPSWPPASAVKCLKWRYSQVPDGSGKIFVSFFRYF